MLIVGNWKGYIESTADARALIVASRKVAAKSAHDIVIAPPFPYIGIEKNTVTSKLIFGAQDVSCVAGGAATGEVSAKSLKGLGVSHVIVGHSERRARGESDALVLEKVRQVLAQGMTPVVCVGELERDDEAAYLGFVRSQITSLYSALSPKEQAKVVIAYEPIWAIGAAQASTPEDIREMVSYIRKILADSFPGTISKRAKILYGGSVDAENAKALAEGTGIQGFLVGRASTNPTVFGALIKALS